MNAAGGTARSTVNGRIDHGSVCVGVGQHFTRTHSLSLRSSCRHHVARNTRDSDTASLSVVSLHVGPWWAPDHAADSNIIESNSYFQTTRIDTLHGGLGGRAGENVKSIGSTRIGSYSSPTLHMAIISSVTNCGAAETNYGRRRLIVVEAFKQEWQLLCVNINQSITEQNSGLK